MDKEMVQILICSVLAAVAFCVCYALCKPQSSAQERVVLTTTAIIIIAGCWQLGEWIRTGLVTLGAF